MTTEERVKRLERENRWMKVGGGALVLALLVVLLGGPLAAQDPQHGSARRSTREYVNHILAHCDSNDARVRYSAREALISLGRVAVPRLKAAVDASRGGLREFHKRTLAEIERRKHLKPFVPGARLNALVILRSRRLDPDWLAVEAELSLGEVTKLVRVLQQFKIELNELIDTVLAHDGRDLRSWSLFKKEVDSILGNLEAGLWQWLRREQVAAVCGFLGRSIKGADTVIVSGSGKKAERISFGAQDFTFDPSGVLVILGPPRTKKSESPGSRKCPKGESP